MKAQLLLMTIICTVMAGCCADMKMGIMAYGKSVEQQAGTSQLLLQRCRKGDDPACSALNQSLITQQQAARILQGKAAKP